MALTVDEIFEKIGSYGRFQIFLTCTLGLICFMPGFQQLVGTFIAAEPGWKCVHSNSTKCNLTGVYTVDSPKDEYTFRCHIPRSDWEFFTPYNYTSVITKWDLVCDRAILGTFATSLVLLGVLPGNLIFGAIADKHGRKKTLFFAVYLCTFAATGSALVPDYWMFAALRFITGIGVGGTALLSIILPVEFVGVRHRGTAGMSVQLFWALSLMILALVAYFIREWWKLNLILAVIGFPTGIFWICIPESIRWYVLRGKTKKAEKLLKKIAKFNGTEMPEEQLEIPRDGELGNAEKQNFLDLFRTWKLAKQTLILWFMWFVNAMVYYGVALSSGNLGGNMYLDFFLSSAVEFPSTLVGIVFMNRFGRKFLVVGGLILAALSSAACALGFPPENTSPGMTAGRIITALLAKFFIAPAFCASYVFSAELLPTSIRNVGVGSCSAVGRIGSFSAPYVLFLGKFWNVLPYGVMALFSLAAGVLCLTLNETNMQPTKEVVQVDDEPRALNHADKFSSCEHLLGHNDSSDCTVNNVQA